MGLSLEAFTCLPCVINVILGKLVVGLFTASMLMRYLFNDAFYLFRGVPNYDYEPGTLTFLRITRTGRDVRS